MSQPIDTDQAQPAIRWSRRGLIAAGAAAAGSTLLPAPAAAHAEPHQTRGFAMITDMHANLDTATRTQHLRSVMAHIAQRNPTAVLNCGDITDFGVADEFALYRSTVPDALWSRIHHVPGNHEEQWNADALEAYRRWFGPTRHSFTIDGVHFVGFDPLVSQEWSWHLSDDLIDWLEADLRRQHPRTPIVAFNHFPMAAGWYYIKNSERFTDLLSKFPIRLLLSGHAHQLQVNRFNGTTQLVGNAIKNLPLYYWIERNHGDAFTITQVTLNDDNTATEQQVAKAPLTRPGPGGALGPLQVKTGVAHDAVTVRVRTAGPATTVNMQLYPQGGPPAPWQPLTPAANGWRGSWPIAALPAGLHRITVRAIDQDGAAFDQTTPFEIEPRRNEPRVAWSTRLDGRIQGDLAAHGNLLVAGTVTGDLRAFTITPHGARPHWRRRLGGIYKGAAFSRSGATIYLGTADHHMYAIATDTGAIRWRRDLGAPIECDLLVTRTRDADRLIVVAGHQLFALTNRGDIVWQADLGGSFSGKPSCDGHRVFAASSTSDAHAFDASTGKQLWTTRLTNVSDTYHQILNGPWAARIHLAPDGGVLIPTVTKVVKLDPINGDILWTTTGIQGSSYTPPTVTDAGLLLFEGGSGTALLLDLNTGAKIWADHTLPRSRSAGPIRTDHSDQLLMATNTGTLVHINVTRRVITPLLQTTRAFSLSTGALIDAVSPVLVCGDKDGRLTGVVNTLT